MKMSEILAGLASARTTASEQVTATTAFATAAFGTRQTVGRAMNQTRFDGLQTEGVL